MPEPREFRVLQNLQAALRGISKANGYHHTLAAVAVKLDPNHEASEILGNVDNFPFALIDVGADAFAYEPSMRTDIRIPITLHAVDDSDSTDDASWMRTFYRLCADLEQAIAVDITRGGLAVVTNVLGREFHTFGGQQVWAMVKTEVRVKRGYGAPNA